MHQKRQTVTTKIPITRKGTKFVARALSHHRDSVPVVIAVRDMLKLAKNAKEVKKMIHVKALKINGKPVRDHRESIRLFNIFEADQPYELTLSNTHRFTLLPAKKKDERLCKVINKKLLKGNQIQINLHDGSNVLSSDKISVNDSVYLDFSQKIKSHVPFEKGKKAFVISGKYSGLSGKIDSIVNHKAAIKLDNKETPVLLPKRRIIVL